MDPFKLFPYPMEIEAPMVKNSWHSMYV